MGKGKKKHGKKHKGEDALDKKARELVDVTEGASAEAKKGKKAKKGKLSLAAPKEPHAIARAKAHREEGKRARDVVEEQGSRRHVDLYDLYESIHYREFKILLKAEDFSDLGTEVHDYWKLARRVAGQLLISVRRGPEETVGKVRDIIFLDTPDSDLYRNSLMLRVRRPYVGGVPGKAYELTLKFRDPEITKAAEEIVVPAKGVAGGRVKFKEEILLVGSALGGMRSIFSHTCQIPNRTEPIYDTLGEYTKIFPGLAKLGLKPKTKIRPAAPVGVQEVLYDLGEFGFRGAKTAKVNMAVWRDTKSQKIMIGEFAYETHFRHYGRLNPIPKLRSERLYRLLQRETGAWVELGTTKTAMYYALSGKKLDHNE